MSDVLIPPRATDLANFVAATEGEAAQQPASVPVEVEAHAPFVSGLSRHGVARSNNPWYAPPGRACLNCED